MLQAIGLMIGAYILTKMLYLMARMDKDGFGKGTQILVGLFALGTFFLTIVMCIALLVAGSTTSLPPFHSP
ncbi:MAG TPA: hypothetical protein VKU00_03380 [Chthonomonadaceae bacterium]|nr:hypothetical protein [Chthonomonadaceae bacterium]